jgi:hypothetical protein
MSVKRNPASHTSRRSRLTQLRIMCCCLFALSSHCLGAQPPTKPESIGAGVTRAPAQNAGVGKVIAQPIDSAVVAQLQAPLTEGRKRVEAFFGKPFARSFDVEVFADRAAFDRYFQNRWKVPKTEAWMVAAGVADRFMILSPRVWKTQAVEHNPADAAHLQDLIAHELVHVYHGQRNSTGDFDGMDDLGWFVEGLAVYVSGQLGREHRGAAKDAIRAGKEPHQLANAWSGRYRYGVCGSLVEFVDQRWGRDVVWKLLSATKPEAALRLLGVTEAQFLKDWKNFVTTQP